MLCVKVLLFAITCKSYLFLVTELLKQRPRVCSSINDSHSRSRDSFYAGQSLLWGLAVLLSGFKVLLSW